MTAARRSPDTASALAAYRCRVDPFVKLTRVPRRPPLIDLLIAGALLAWALIEAFLDRGPGPFAGRVAFAVAITAVLAVRRQAPGLVVIVLSVATLAWALPARVAETGTNPFPSFLLAAFSVACYARRRAVAVAGGLSLFAVMLAVLESDFYSAAGAGPGDLAILSVFFGGAWTAGWLVRQRAAQARRVLAESGELARSAVNEERTRIARELHDVVAHSVSIIAVQAGAAEEMLEYDPERARAHIASVRRTAREAMTEMRRVLDVLRAEEPRYAPQPGLARLPDLLDEVRASDVPVELIEQGERPRLPPGIDLVAFRVVQESLTNVRKHAPGAPTCVLLRYGPKILELEVANASGSPAASGNGSAPGGHGLIGMRERVHLFGGSFDAQPTAEGGFRVHAMLPLTEEPA
jgi:signal transduction histidine kinase